MLDVTLRAGDTLYLPRGWPHEAFSADADSLHITVGLHPPTRIDALRAALGECADDVEFRRGLDAGGELPPSCSSASPRAWSRARSRAARGGASSTDGDRCSTASSRRCARWRG